MDLASIQNVDEHEFEVIHPKTRKGTGIFFMLLGQTHPVRRAGTLDIQTAFRGKSLTDAEIAADKERADTEWLARCTSGWRQEVRNADGTVNEAETGPFVLFDGNKLGYSFDKARALYADPKYLWLRDQMDVNLGKTVDFIVDSAPTSAPGSTGTNG